jgi:HAD superfamily hydrolase (TIGR01509 family)
MRAPAILFDFNGVLVDDEPLHAGALIATLAEYGIPLDRDGYAAAFLGVDDRAGFRRAFAERGHAPDDATLAEAIARKHEHYLRAAGKGVPWVPGARAFVEAAAEEGYRLAIVSGALRREIETALEAAGLHPCFATIVAAEDVEASKPDPAGYLLARRTLGVAPGRAVVIEDSLPGLAAARAAGGMRRVAIATSHPPEALADADLVWTDFEGHAPSELPWTHAIR